jgi:hypothetical protein
LNLQKPTLAIFTVSPHRDSPADDELIDVRVKLQLGSINHRFRVMKRRNQSPTSIQLI